MSSVTLFSIGADAKTSKGESLGYRTAIMYLAPATAYTIATGESRPTLCPHAGACERVCLATTAGRMRFHSVRQAQVRRTQLWWQDRERFRELMFAELVAHVRSCARAGVRPLARPNGASDILWEREFPELFTSKELEPLEFYDYTKIPLRYRRPVPGRYSLTFSRDEKNHAEALSVLANGGNVAIVTDKPCDTIDGYPVVDGDTHDIRLPSIDGRGVWIRLKPKGSATRDDTGFVYRLPTV